MSLIDREAFIAGLVSRYGTSREAAERRWQALNAQPGASGARAPLAEPTPEDDAALEADVQREVIRLFRAMGGDVYELSQKRAAKQTPGLPDLWCFMPRRRLGFWWETKRPRGGRLSPAQVHFAEQCAATGTPYGTGALRDAEDFLILRRIAYRTPTGVMEPMPPLTPDPSES
jgi:hypothetical protein